LLPRAISEPWFRPEQLVASALSLLERDAIVAPCIDRAVNTWPARLSVAELFGEAGIAALSRNDLLCRTLESAPAYGVRIERFLTAARAAMLDAVRAGEGARLDDALGFCAALARQCFVNEYVYAMATHEEEAAQALRRDVEAALDRGDPTSAISVAVCAAYFSLGELARARALLAREWPPPLAALIEQQIAEPAAELALDPQLRALTPIVEPTSSQVRAHYEENPYPRWVRHPREQRRATIAATIARQCALATPPLLADRDTVDVLVAGCGTGRQAIDVAQRVIGARVLAVDLSRASLRYALRKTRELGVDNIEYAQADLLELPPARTFDVVYADGVLHHLADPLSGWRALCALLRPGGCMHVSLYSERARAHVAGAREVIVARGYRATAAGIRECRQQLIGAAASTPLEPLLQSADFFVTSGCRDLLFHVREQRFTLPRIGDALAALGLRLVGFDVDPALHRRFRERFADDDAGDELQRWHRFELEFPQTFRAMYALWVQKPASV
jgi:2-polyprenyl-3-methyl-5-hydroxy-6-metoxy-1,4-benzoquinol methylase